MHIVRVATENGPAWGVVEDHQVRRLPNGPFGSIEVAEELGSLDDLTLLAPATPSKIVCVGRNYAAHAAEHGAEVPAEPLLFLKPPSSVIAPGAKIVLPELSSQVEHECELALVIGRPCRAVAEERAWEQVLGITCGNDVTARDLQRADPQWTRGKGFDTFCPLGPWIVTGVGENDIGKIEVSCKVDGELRQQGNTEQMVFSPAFLIAYITQIMTLEPGDVIMTGTPSGVGPLHPGDEVTVEVGRVGKLTNPVT
jgi:2-keto-4-pentenoate hydratase/2-oxohepta-3-ene-1,7-dioic acid hydratase in catechol pathway